MFNHVYYLESTDGFIVRFVDDAIMGYEEGERKLQFQIEVISRPSVTPFMQNRSKTGIRCTNQLKSMFIKEIR